MLSYVGLAQTVGLVSGANTKQKSHLGMKVSCPLGIVQALKDKDDLRETPEDGGERLRENGNGELLCALADSCPRGASRVPAISWKRPAMCWPLRARLSSSQARKGGACSRRGPGAQLPHIERRDMVQGCTVPCALEVPWGPYSVSLRLVCRMDNKRAGLGRGCVCHFDSRQTEGEAGLTEP